MRLVSFVLVLVAVASLVADSRPLDEQAFTGTDVRAFAAQKNVEEQEVRNVGGELSGNVTTRYFTNEEMATFMYRLVDECGHIMSLFSIGESSNGAPLLAIDVSSTAGQRDSKPYFHYAGNMHGDEPSGRQLILNMALQMCKQDPQLPSVARLLSSVHLILVPTLNPDGFASRKRHNAHNVDLNRNFPTRTSSNTTYLDEVGVEQPETKAMMDLITNFHFSAGANMHEGALVANYPWDNIPENPSSTEYAATHDDETFKVLARNYASLHTRMSSQTSSKYQPRRSDEHFNDGITNGNAWYPVFGSMQDYIYLMGHCLEITLELSEQKYPASRLLNEMWVENEHALYEFPLNAVLGGLVGSVTQVVGGVSDAVAVEDAQVTVEGSDLATLVQPVGGTFSRPLAAGVYNVTVSATGFTPQQSVVTVPSGFLGAHLDVTLVLLDVATEEPEPVVSPSKRLHPLPLTFPYKVLAGRQNVVSDEDDGGSVLPKKTALSPELRLLVDTNKDDAHSTMWYWARSLLIVVGPCYVLYEMRRRSRRSVKRSGVAPMVRP